MPWPARPAPTLADGTRRSSAACDWADFPTRGARAGRSNSISASVGAAGRRASFREGVEGARPSELRHSAFCGPCHRRRGPSRAFGGAPLSGGRQRGRPASDPGDRRPRSRGPDRRALGVPDGLGSHLERRRRAQPRTEPSSRPARTPSSEVAGRFATTTRRRCLTRSISASERGASLSEALKQAKAQAIAANRPAAAWASLVLLGDGDFRPFPGGRSAPPAKRWPSFRCAGHSRPASRRARLAARPKLSSPVGQLSSRRAGPA